jgi:hypothetical protein
MGVEITYFEIWETWKEVLEKYSTNKQNKTLSEFLGILDEERWKEAIGYNINEYLKEEISQYEQYRERENSYQKHYEQLLFSGLIEGLHPRLKKAIKEFKQTKIEWLVVEPKSGKTRKGVKGDFLIKFCNEFIMDELKGNKILRFEEDDAEKVTKEIFISIIKKKLPSEIDALTKRYSRIF